MLQGAMLDRHTRMNKVLRHYYFLSRHNKATRVIFFFFVVSFVLQQHIDSCVPCPTDISLQSMEINPICPSSPTKFDTYLACEERQGSSVSADQQQFTGLKHRRAVFRRCTEGRRVRTAYGEGLANCGRDVWVAKKAVRVRRRAG